MMPVNDIATNKLWKCMQTLWNQLSDAKLINVWHYKNEEEKWQRKGQILEIKIVKEGESDKQTDREGNL